MAHFGALTCILVEIRASRLVRITGRTQRNAMKCNTKHSSSQHRIDYGRHSVFRFRQHKPPHLRCNSHRHRNQILIASAAPCSSQNPEKAEASQPITSPSIPCSPTMQKGTFYQPLFYPNSHNDQPRARAPSPFCFPAIEALKMREFEHGCFLRSFAAARAKTRTWRVRWFLCACLLLGDL